MVIHRQRFLFLVYHCLNKKIVVVTVIAVAVGLDLFVSRGGVAMSSHFCVIKCIISGRQYYSIYSHSVRKVPSWTKINQVLSFSLFISLINLISSLIIVCIS
jgi:hypothetical protein